MFLEKRKIVVKPRSDGCTGFAEESVKWGSKEGVTVGVEVMLIRYLLGLSGIGRFGKSFICNVGGLFLLPTVLDNGSTSRHPGSTNLALTGFIIAPKATGGSTPLCRHFSNHGIFGFIPLSRLGYRVILSTALFSNARNLSC